MKVFKDHKIVTISIISLVFLFVFAPVAVANHPYPEMPRIRGEQTATPSSTEQDSLSDQIQNKKDLIQEGLSKNNLIICERLEAGINSRSGNLVNKVNKHTARFDRISNKVQDFYTEKMVPKGITVENYDALVGDISTKKAVVDEAVAKASSTISDFDCSSDHPKQLLSDFKDQMQSVIKSLKDYRKSVVNLIIAVRTSFNNAKDKEATSSAN